MVDEPTWTPPAPVQRVVVTDVQMPFLSMVIFMLKWALACIPAAFILFMVVLFFAAIGSLPGR